MAKIKEEPKRVILVLSAGRSGSSLIMQILGALGMSVSDNLIAPHYDNPDGFFEDSEVVNLHKQLLADLGAKSTRPLPAGWMGDAVVAPYRSKIRTLIEDRISKANTIWGFKDPRTCALLPLWIEILRSMRITPYFVLAVREPSVAVRSIIKQTNLVGEKAELVWLVRTCDALFNAASDCYVVHYEDWFVRPEQVATDLLKQTGLVHSFKGNVAKALEVIIKPNLSRATYDEYKITNTYIKQLYDVLGECHGVNFDRTRLMRTVEECRMAMDSFRGWYTEGKKHSQSAEFSGLTAERAEQERALIEKDEKLASQLADLEKLTLQNNAYLKQLKALHERAEGLSIKLQSLAQPPAVAKRPPLEVKPVAIANPSAAPTASEAGRKGKLWRKLRKDPHGFFSDSRVAIVKPLRHLFKERF